MLTTAPLMEAALALLLSGADAGADSDDGIDGGDAGICSDDNGAIYGCNAAIYADNDAIYGCNAAIYADNDAIYGGGADADAGAGAHDVDRSLTPRHRKVERCTTFGIASRNCRPVPILF